MKEKLNHLTHRILVMVLVVVMLLGLLPTTLYATTTNDVTAFTLQVTDVNSQGVEAVNVRYEIFQKTYSIASGDVKTNQDGIATIDEMKKYETAITNGEIFISYQVSKEGYVTQSTSNVQVMKVDETIAVSLLLSDSLKAHVTMVKKGSGSVTMNGLEHAELDVKPNDTMELNITPIYKENAKTYIKLLKINDQVVEVTKYQAYKNDALVIADDTNIEVVFATEYIVTTKQSEGGSIQVNGITQEQIAVDENSQAILNVKPKEGYQIASVNIDGIQEDMINKQKFEKNLTITKHTLIQVTFQKVYTISFTYDQEHGLVTTNSQSIGGNVDVEEGDQVTITATPNVNYRVSKVIKNKIRTEFTDNDYVYEDTVHNIMQDYTYEITFAYNTFQVAKEPSEHGQIIIDNATSDYNRDVHVTLIPDQGYVLDRVSVNEIDVNVSQSDNDSLAFTIENIDENKTITAIFKPMRTIDLSDVSFNSADALRKDEASQLYVFANNSNVTFRTGKNGIRINGSGSWKSNSITFTSTTIITSMELYYREDGRLFGSWHTVTLPAGGIHIAIDQTKPTVTLIPDEAVKNDYYNSNVNVTVRASDEALYSGIANMEYWVKKDGTETQHEVIKGNAASIFETKFVVDASLNNSDQVDVMVLVRDLAGNEYTVTKRLKINTTKPKVSINIDGALHKDAEKGYYHTARTAMITIIDRAGTFNETDAFNGITISAKNQKNEDVPISKATMLTWQHDGDKHVGTLTFSEDANYEWSFAYTNNANLSNDTINETGVDIYHFTVDQNAPTGAIHMESKTWKRLLSSLTFGIFKNYAVTAQAIGEDNTSPIQSIMYFKTDAKTMLTVDDLNKEYSNGLFVKEPYTSGAEEQYIIYARICDYAGNATYISTEGIIIDKTKSTIDITPEKPNQYGLYNTDVKVHVAIQDSMIDSTTYSGIKSVSYRVLCNGTQTQSETLFEFDNTSPKQSDLVSQWGSDFVVEKEKNNSDNVEVLIDVEDNAGNKSTKSITLSINIDTPKVEIQYKDKPNQVVDGRGYFSTNREATIVVTDRVSSFDSDAIRDGMNIQAVDAKGKSIPLNDMLISEWTSTGDIHKATIYFNSDANYQWSLSYTNKADNSMDSILAHEDETPFLFTVDKTAPTGQISIDDDSWAELLEMLTFGLYRNEKVQVRASSDDDISPVTVTYFKTSDTTALTADVLDKKTFEPYHDFSIDSDERFVVYLKVMDFAGNYVYLNTNGFIVDMEKSEIKLTPSQPVVSNEDDQIYGYYNDNVEVQVDVQDKEPYSGIKTVDYWIEVDGNYEQPTQKENLYTFDKKDPVYEDLISEWSGTIVVDAQKNNSCDVVVYVKTVDNAGNEEVQSIPLDIDVRKPAISITYDNNQDYEGNGYFNATRKATLTITERTAHFNKEKATSGIEITAVDALGNNVELDPATMISDWKTTEGKQKDEATHTATIHYTNDANYTFAIAYCDEASNRNDEPDTKTSKAPYTFTVDKTAPTGTIQAESKEGRVTTWDTLLSRLTFGFWSNKEITITGTSDDLTSPVASVMYYKSASINVLNETQLKNIKEWQPFNTFHVYPNEQFSVYLKIMDMAGNTTYISSDGMIVDDTSPSDERIAPIISAQPQQPINNIYSGDVTVDILVEDPMISETYSGLKHIQYRVLNMGKETQTGILYTFDKASPTHEELLKQWKGTIRVDSKLNNSNDVVVEIYAQDNSLNSTINTISMKIDISKPVISISYDNNNPDSQSFYQANRKATIVVSERNFTPDDVQINISNTDGSIPTINEWKTTIGSGNQDNTIHKATILYQADGDYTFDMNATDLAGNRTNDIHFADGTMNAKQFTIDKTAPEISVQYDNNDVQNTFYFGAPRAATITIKEHNFEMDRVTFQRTASLQEGAVSLPVISWEHRGDIHTAHIAYQDDGDYTFDMTMKDKAGNLSDKPNYGKANAPSKFTIDTSIEEPIIAGIKNGSAYKDAVVPSIKFSDINYSNSEVKLTRTRRNEINVDVSKQFLQGLQMNDQGGSGTFDTFDRINDNDGIYTLYAKIVDKAGNERDTSMTFTVNRFGSVYEYGEYLVSLMKNGGAYVTTLEDDLHVYEYNADRLLADSLVLEITKDGRPLSNITYEVSPVINDQVRVGTSGWYQYEYTIAKENFKEDGVYKIAISSKDATGNIPENHNQEGSDILFRVDQSAPELTSITGLEHRIINASKVPVTYTIYDSIGIKSVSVFIDGERYEQPITDFEDMNNYTGTFTLSEKSSAQTVRFVVEDMAGNTTDTDSTTFQSAYNFEKNVIISTNLFVRWYANSMLFWGSIGTIIVILAGMGYVFIFKKRKKVDREKA